MTNESKSTIQSHAWHWLLLSVSVFAIVFGLLLTVGFLSNKHSTGLDMGDFFLAFITLVFFYFLPALFIARSLKLLRAHYQLGRVGVAGILLFGIMVFLSGTFMKTYNQFVQADENINQAFTNVEMAYQKRFNLITNLDAAARRYESHERQVVQDIVEARKAMLTATTAPDKIATFDRLDTATRALAVNIEQYPNLKADQVVQTLMKEIASTEKDLLELKSAHNARVTDYNKSVRLMPFALVARLFGFRPKQIINKESGGSDIYDAQKLLTTK